MRRAILIAMRAHPHRAALAGEEHDLAVGLGREHPIGHDGVEMDVQVELPAEAPDNVTAPG